MSKTLSDRMTRILDAARWAPSGDNTQPWRFEVEDDDTVIIHASDTRHWCVYDLEGHASQIAVGALLENIVIAASREELETDLRLLPDGTDTHPRVRARFRASNAITPDPLFEIIAQRSTQRRALSWSALRPADRMALEGAPGPGYRVFWVEGVRQKWRLARLLFLNAYIRLTIEEAYQVHKRIIAWDSGFSEDRIPDRALGLDPFALAIMKWAMASWRRVSFMNRYLGATLLPRLELDVLPSMGCAAHFFIVADKPPIELQDYFNGGRAMQRFWLTATAQGLQFQPQMTPIIFSEYTKRSLPFTASAEARRQAARLRAGLCELIGESVLDRVVFAGRVGYGPQPRWRSLRLPLPRLRAS